MKARETLYYAASVVLSPSLQRDSVIRLFSLFSFPSHSEPLLNSGLKRWFRQFGFLLFIATVLILFGANLAWSLIVGRAMPDADVTTRNFLEDLPNIFNYTLICPLYVTLCFAFLVHIRSLRSALRSTGLVDAVGLGNFQQKASPLNYVAAAVAIASASTLSISFFLAELPRYRFLFWFQEVSSSGDKILSAHGYYYLITNLFLNLIVITTVAAHFELFAVATRIGAGLAPLARSREAPADELLRQSEVVQLFQPFSSLYLLSKALIVVVLANMYTWRAQQPDFTGMLDLTIVVLALLGFAVVSYPRYHIQYWIFRLWRKHSIEQYPELRPPLAVGWASIADFVILGGAMTNLVAYVLERSGIRLTLF